MASICRGSLLALLRVRQSFQRGPLVVVTSFAGGIYHYHHHGYHTKKSTKVKSKFIKNKFSKIDRDSNHDKIASKFRIDSEKSVYNCGRTSKLHLPNKLTYKNNLDGVESIDSFDSLRIFPSVREAMIQQIKSEYDLKNTYITNKQDLQIKPSPIQIATIKKINQPRGKNPLIKSKAEDLSPGELINRELIIANENAKMKVFTLAAETGSGKTWGYLSSILSNLKEDDLILFNESIEKYEKSKKNPIIRAVILVPTHELIDQVYQTLKSANNVEYDLSKMNVPKNYQNFLNHPDEQKKMNLKIMKFGPGVAPTKIFDQCNQNGRIDVLVTTPTKITALQKLVNFNRPFRYFLQVEYCVVDEADTLFDESWVKDTTEVLTKFPKCKDLILCSATIPKDFESTLSKFPNSSGIIKIVTPQLHKIPRSILVKIIDAQQNPYSGSKPRALAQALYAISKDGTEQGFVKRILIFVNEKKSVEPMIDMLVKKYNIRQQDIDGIIGSDSPESRMEKIKPFLNPAELIEDDIDQSKVKILVTTDLLSRGLNFNGIKNVILYDTPKSSVDLIHRIGRTGRMRRSGRVFIIIDKETNKSWVKGLPGAIKKGIRMG